MNESVIDWDSELGTSLLLNKEVRDKNSDSVEAVKVRGMRDEIIIARILLDILLNGTQIRDSDLNP